MSFRKWLLSFDPKEFRKLKERSSLLESKVEKANTLVEYLKEMLSKLYESKSDVESVTSARNITTQFQTIYQTNKQFKVFVF